MNSATASGNPPPAASGPNSHAGRSPLHTWFEILFTSLRLGLTSFGGPIAHLAYFREEYVARRGWLDDKTYADIVALCQFLPGPASSQVGMSVGILRGGLWGGIAAWLGFTLPSALALAFFARAMQGYDVAAAGWLRGLLIVAVAVVAHAVWGMATRLAPDRERIGLAVGAAVATLLAPGAAVQIVLIALGALAGRLLLQGKVESTEGAALKLGIGRVAALTAWVLFFGLLVLLPVVSARLEAIWLAVFDVFFRVGSLVFGGGHVVLPLLASEVVGRGWLAQEQFLAGYGAAQAIPGPLFTFSAFVGTSMGGFALGATALVAMFLPSFLLVVGALPFWDAIRGRAAFRSALAGINAVVVGILLAALYDPIWTKAIHSAWDFALALVAFVLLKFWQVPPWGVVLFCAAAGAAIGAAT